MLEAVQPIQFMVKNLNKFVMEFKKNIIAVSTLITIVCLVVLAGVKFYYFDIYLMQLNGKVENVRIDIKQALYITVSKKEYNMAHFWPKLHANVETGDFVYKKSKNYDIILVKRATRKKVICTYK